MKKYKITNCPAYNKNGVYYDCWMNQLSWCQNIDCVLKKTLEFCRKQAETYPAKTEKEITTVNGYQAILNMYAVEEV